MYTHLHTHIFHKSSYVQFHNDPFSSEFVNKYVKNFILRNKLKFGKGDCNKENYRITNLFQYIYILHMHVIGYVVLYYHILYKMMYTVYCTYNCTYKVLYYNSCTLYILRYSFSIV